MRLPLCLTLLVAVAFPLRAQEARRPAPLISPEIKANHEVVFRLAAPQAREVSLHGQWVPAPLPLRRDAEGVWTATAEAVPAGVWEYSFTVDGLTMLDPANPALKPMRQPRTSILHLSATPPQPWDFQDVAHGTVHQHSYLSKALARPRELVVYTPAGYETDAARTYPLLVLQHGSGDNQQTWVAHGKAHWILDSLIAAGKARPMIVLMLDGHPLESVSFRDPAARAEALMAFQRELFEDALPLVESRYRVEKDPALRAITGLSMGGAQSLQIGLSHLERFAWIGSFSGLPPEEPALAPFLADPATANSELRLLWIACGQEDFLRPRNEEFVEKLKSSGIAYQWHLGEGGHTWPVWRQNLADFLPLLFQPPSTTR